MNVIILAAGSGIRLGEHTQDIPKTLVDINGKSILERQISLLRKHKVKEIFVVIGYKKETYVLKDVEYFFNPKYSETEQLTSMMVARRKIFGDVLIIFGDIIFDSDILKQVLASNDDITIPIDLDWKKSYEEEPNKPADIFWLNRKEIGKISAKEISLESKNEVGEFLGIIKLSIDGSRILDPSMDNLIMPKNSPTSFFDSNEISFAEIFPISFLFNQNISAGLFGSSSYDFFQSRSIGIVISSLEAKTCLSISESKIISPKIIKTSPKIFLLATIILVSCSVSEYLGLKKYSTSFRTYVSFLYPITTNISLTLCFLNNEICRSKIDLPLISTRVFGISCVCSPNRIPEPAANIITFIMYITHPYL